jgi:hypothetical protein
MTSSGQADSQLKHMWHSSCRHLTPPCGESAPWQWTRHRLQSVHLAWSFSIPKSENLESQPSSAPSGHSTRHQNRGIRFMNRMATKSQ